MVGVVTIIDLLPITIIDASRGLRTAGVPVASSLSASDRRSVLYCLQMVERGTNHGSRSDAH